VRAIAYLAPTSAKGVLCTAHGAPRLCGAYMKRPPPRRYVFITMSISSAAREAAMRATRRLANAGAVLPLRRVWPPLQRPTVA